MKISEVFKYLSILSDWRDGPPQDLAETVHLWPEKNEILDLAILN